MSGHTDLLNSLGIQTTFVESKRLKKGVKFSSEMMFVDSNMLASSSNNNYQYFITPAIPITPITPIIPIIPRHSFQMNFDIEEEDPSEDNKPISMEIQQRKITTKQKQQAANQSQGCKCKKSQCLKSYCQCFSRGGACSDKCRCVGCSNTGEKKIQNKNGTGKRVQENGATYCLCKKSKCMKKYCDCHNEGRKCGIYCQCLQCENQESKKEIKEKRKAQSLKKNGRPKTRN